MTEEIVWEEPATDSRGGSERQWSPRLAPLHERPNVWARVKVYAKAATAAQAANHLRKGRIAGVDPADYQFTSRTLPDGTGAVYARFVGQAVKAAS